MYADEILDFSGKMQLNSDNHGDLQPFALNAFNKVATCSTNRGVTPLSAIWVSRMMNWGRWSGS